MNAAPERRDDDAIIASVSGRKAVGGLLGSDEEPLVLMELLQRLRVCDVMLPAAQIVSCKGEETLREAQRKMRDNHVSGLPVADGDRLYGIVSVNDVIRALEGAWIDDPCAWHMAKNLVVLEANMPLAFALKSFENYTFGRFPVLDEQRRLVGLISQRDVTRALVRELTREIERMERGTAAKSREQDAAFPDYELRQFPVVHNDLTNAGKAAAAIKQMLKDMKVENRIVRRVAVAAYELEINVCIHSVGGALTFIVSNGNATLVAKDSGPGIADVEWACQDGTSTANDWIRSLGFGAGMGLANCKRVSDNFEIQSKVGKGTIVTCEFKLGEKAAPAQDKTS